MLEGLFRALAKEAMKMKKPHDTAVVENIHKQIDNLLAWAPEFGAVEIKICFHDGKIAKTEERRMVAVLRTSED